MDTIDDVSTLCLSDLRDLNEEGEREREREIIVLRFLLIVWTIALLRKATMLKVVLV